MLLTPEVLRTRPRFDDCIGLIDAREERVDRNYGYQWARYAGLGVKALIACRPELDDQSSSYPGFVRHLMFMADPYGQFERPHMSREFCVFDDLGLTPIAVRFGSDGLISFMKDEGDTSQRLFKSIMLDRLEPETRENVTVAIFRASPVAALDLQRAYKMADEHTLRLHERTETNVGVTGDPEESLHNVIRAAREAVIFATLNHPLLR